MTIQQKTKIIFENLKTEDEKSKFSYSFHNLKMDDERYSADDFEFLKVYQHLEKNYWKMRIPP